MKKIIFPIQKATLKQFTRWQAERRTATISLESIFNYTINLLFERGFISLIADNNASLQVNEPEWRKISVCLDDGIYEKMQDFKLKYGDFKFAKLKELIAIFVEMSCDKAQKIISEASDL